jgi:hypothetical protein
MLFPRCIHRRLCCVLLHEFHTTRPYLRESLDAFQINPTTAHVIIASKPPSQGRSQSKSDSRKSKTLRAGKQRKEKSDRMEHSSDSDMLSSRLRLHNKRVRCPRTVGRAEIIGPRLARVPNGGLSSPSGPTEREAHVGASENAGGSSCPFHAVLFHLLPSSVRSQRRSREYIPSTQLFTTWRRWRNLPACLR